MNEISRYLLDNRSFDVDRIDETVALARGLDAAFERHRFLTLAEVIYFNGLIAQAHRRLHDLEMKGANVVPFVPQPTTANDPVFDDGKTPA